MDLYGCKYSSRDIEGIFTGVNYVYGLLPPNIQRKYFSNSLVQFSRETQTPVKVKK